MPELCLLAPLPLPAFIIIIIIIIIHIHNPCPISSPPPDPPQTPRRSDPTESYPDFGRKNPPHTRGRHEQAVDPASIVLPPLCQPWPGFISGCGWVGRAVDR